MRLFIRSFGCRVNQYETESLRERLAGEGSGPETADYKEADLCLVNTCSVTGEADREALKLLRLITRDNPGARLVVTGCLATRDPGSVRRSAPHAEIVDNTRKDDIPSLLGCRVTPESGGIAAFRGHSRAFVKIQDGCDMNCSYCIIPAVRPRLQSRPVSELRDEIERLVGAGFSEIVLCGIRLGRYLSEETGRRVDFVGLLERLSAVKGSFRLRLSSIEITDVTDRLIALMAGSGGRICPSIHVPLQSGSDRVLKLMRRWYSADFYRRRILALKRVIPHPGLFSDVMTGFPGESAEDVEDTVRLIEELEFSGLHVFRYSPRPSTDAASLPGLMPEKDAAERGRRLRALDERLRAAFAKQWAGKIRTGVALDGGREALTDEFLTVRMSAAPIPPGLRPIRILPNPGRGEGGGKRKKPLFYAENMS
jgi:threonylcarbamoyladenosine tRNA methylthiotransferase MtaB